MSEILWGLGWAQNPIFLVQIMVPLSSKFQWFRIILDHPFNLGRFVNAISQYTVPLIWVTLYILTVNGKAWVGRALRLFEDACGPGSIA